MRSRKWDELSITGKLLVMALTSVQISLAVSAWTDLAQRSAEQVDGSKRTWAAIIAVSFVGPLLYFRRGRRTATWTSAAAHGARPGALDAFTGSSTATRPDSPARCRTHPAE